MLGNTAIEAETTQYFFSLNLFKARINGNLFPLARLITLRAGTVIYFLLRRVYFKANSPTRTTSLVYHDGLNSIA